MCREHLCCGRVCVKYIFFAGPDFTDIARRRATTGGATARVMRFDYATCRRGILHEKGNSSTYFFSAPHQYLEERPDTIYDICAAYMMYASSSLYYFSMVVTFCVTLPPKRYLRAAEHYFYGVAKS